MPVILTNDGQNSSGANYDVDIVMCIDGTGSMAPIIQKVKDNALTFYPKFVEAMESQAPPKRVKQLRIKVITFRDYKSDSQPMVESEFFDLSDNSNAEPFKDYVNCIEAIGGGDAPENALEALALAMKSDWSRESGTVHRHVIMMFTDTEALPLQARAGESGYPTDMPSGLPELRDMWDGQYMEFRAKRLLIFAPDCEPWSDMVDWSNFMYKARKAGDGLSDVEFDTCIKMLVNSI